MELLGYMYLSEHTSNADKMAFIIFSIGIISITLIIGKFKK